MDEPEERSWWRRPLIYTIAVLVASAVGVSVVFVVGSANRRSDRNALVAYEKAVLPLVRDAGRVVEQEMKPTLRDVAEGRVTDQQIVQRAAAWEAVFNRVRAGLLELTPPELLGDIQESWSTAMGGYLLVVDAFEAIASSPADTKKVAIDQATLLGERADELFDQVAGVIQFHRRRLDLGTSPDLPDPTPSGTS